MGSAGTRLSWRHVRRFQRFFIRQPRPRILRRFNVTKEKDRWQDALIPDEITPLMLLALTAKASRMKDAAAAFRIAASKMLDLATKDEYIEKYKNIDPITDALYDACDLSQHIFDAANAVNDLINYPVEARERVVKADIERSLLDPWRDLPTSGGDVDPDTGEIKED